MVKKSNKRLKGGMVRSGSVQHFRRGKLLSKTKISNKRLKGGMVRSGSVQHFRRGKSKYVLKKRNQKNL